MLRNKNAADAAPALDAVAVTPSDVTDLTEPARALYIGTAGNVALVTLGGNVVTFVGVVGLLQVGAKRVNATNTTAANIVALY